MKGHETRKKHRRDDMSGLTNLLALDMLLTNTADGLDL